MKVLVFGSTGTVGKEVVREALSQGHEVTAFTRDSARVTTQHNLLQVACGDVLDPQAVARVVPGHDAVIIALGAGMNGEVREQGTQNVIDAMKHAGVQRLVCLSSLGVGESRGNLNFFWKRIMFGMLLRKAFADHVAQEEKVRQSGMSWTIVRPGAFTDGEATGRFQHGFPPDRKGLKLKISRADVAQFMVDLLTNNRYLGQAPGLSY